ncbi:MAG: S8 family serine peptidase [Candidatus Saelkia tenebricola]|nr:S8 family serine peptidase [Candidatus Saelkia tenebricola]
MKKILSGSILFLYCLMGSASAFEGIPYEEGVLLVGLTEELDNLPQDVFQIMNSYNGEIIEGAIIPGVFKLKFPKDANIDEVKKSLESLESIEYVEFNYRFKIEGSSSINLGTSAVDAVSPDDAGFFLQWGLRQVQLPKTWSEEQGSSSVKIAILDTGCDLNHPDLKARIDQENSYNILNPSKSAADDSSSGHGTHIAGIIGAASDNGIGVAGATWKPKIVIIKVADSNGDISMGDLATAIYRARNINGVKVINMSLGGPYFSQSVQTAVRKAHEKGIVLVAAAGNDRSSLKYIPAGYDEVIGVTATDRGDEPCYVFSPLLPTKGTNYNPSGKEYYSVAAPGVDIYSTLSGDSYGYMDGTSMAAAFVSGIAALLISKNPELTPDEVKGIIEDTADPIVNENSQKDIGRGRVNAFEAIYEAGEIVEPPIENDVNAVAWAGERNQKEVEVNVGQEVKFYGDDSTGPENVKLQYFWVFGDAKEPFSNLINPAHTYSKAGEYTVTLFAFTESDLDVDKVTVIVGGDNPSPDKTIISGKVKDKEGGLLGGAEVKIISGLSSLKSVISDKNGNYRFEITEFNSKLTLSAWKQGYKKEVKTVYVKAGESKSVDFNLAVNTGVEAVAWVGEKGSTEIEVATGETVRFYGDDSTGPVGYTYFWVFDDSENPFSFQANPTHVYNNSRTYRVKLIVLTERDLDITGVKVIVK